MGDNIRNYLESWRSRYSYPNYIGDNQFLTSDGKLVEDNLEGYSEAQETLLKGSAIGTASNYFLDPHPLFNRLGEIYSNILGNKAYSSARTDSIKMNRLNMDYTNGKTLRTVEKVEWDCFKFISETQTESIYGTKNANTLNNILNLVLAFKDRNPNSEIIEIDVREVTSNEINIIKYYNKTLVKNTLEEFNNILKEEKFESNPSTSTDNNRYFLKLRFVDPTDGVSSQTEFTIPSKDYYKVYATYKNRKVSEHSGLQLLMPRYARRVEVEDLDENFWVIGQILDAVVKALWGPYGLIDVVRQIIYEVNKDKREDNVNDIKLLHDGSEDLYFDMYSRFTLNDLQLKLVTDSGERIIKNIFKPHTNKIDRKVNNKDTTTNGETTVPKLFEDITEEMYGVTYANDENRDGTDDSGLDVLLYGEGQKNFTGLFDSDLARSAEKVNDGGLYVSLSTVIDAINDKIVTDENHILKGYSYVKDPKSSDFFTKIDPTNGDGQLSPKDLEKIVRDIKEIKTNTTVNRDLLLRLKKYEESYNYLNGLANFGDFPKFIRDTDIGKDDTDIVKFKEKILEKYYKEVNCEVPYVYLNDIYVNKEDKVLEKINNDLDRIYDEVKGIFESSKKIDENTATYSTNIAGNTVEMVSNLYEKYTDLISMGKLKSSSGDVYKFDINSSEGDLRYFKNGLEGLSSTIAQITAISQIDFTNSYLSSDIRIILGVKDFMREDVSYVSTSSLINTNWTLKDMSKGAEAISEFINLVQNICISINTSTQLSTSPIKLIYSNSEKTVTHQFSSRLAAEVLRKSVEGTITITKVVGTDKSKKEKNKFIPYHLESFEPILKDKIPIYSANVAAEIANDIANNLNLIAMEKYLFTGLANLKSRGIDTKYTDGSDPIKEFFDVLDDGKVNVRDAAKISNYGITLGDKTYWKKTSRLEELIDLIVEKDVTDNIIQEKNNASQTYQLSFFFDSIFKKKTGFNFWDNGKKESNYQRLKQYLFTYIDNPLLNTTLTIKFHIPSEEFLSLLIKDNEFYKEGVGWENYTNEDILKFASDKEFRICDNILIYLFDPEYYNLRYVKSVGSANYPSLYVNAVDMYFDDITNPIIPGSLFSGVNIPLFVPHKGLKNGEIIEMQIDGTSYPKTPNTNTHSHFDFNLAVKYVNGETFKPSLKSGLDEKRMNLVLHNSFANNLRQYNYRTTYFIKDTNPLYSLDTETEQLKSISDFFNRGIKLTYFRPQKIVQSINNTTQSITEAQTIRKQLKIYASMIASKYQYIDNSYVLHSDIGDTLEKTDAVKKTHTDYSGMYAPKDCYLFNSRQAYCGATRNNLIFYSTAGTNEFGQFIHSPLLALESPNKFTPSQTIQTPLTTSRGLSGGVTPKYYSVVSGKRQDFSVNGVKDMLYRDGYESKVAPVIDIVWGRRQVSNYIKKKSLDYIIIERELGDRHSIFAPTYVQIIGADGHLHSRDGLQSKNIRAHKVEWYGKNGDKFDKLNYNNGYAPESAIYGVVKLSDLVYNIKYSGNYIIRFFNILLDDNVKEGENPDLNISNANFTISNKDSDGNIIDTIERRPIIKRVYFLGESYNGIRNSEIYDNKD